METREKTLSTFNEKRENRNALRKYQDAFKKYLTDEFDLRTLACLYNNCHHKLFGYLGDSRKASLLLLEWKQETIRKHHN